jgi:hypothetical protein
MSENKPSLITHSQARFALKSLVDAATNPFAQRNEVSLLMHYIQQCEATSKDMRNSVEAILTLWGPEGLKQVLSAVEAGRVPVIGRTGKMVRQ